MFLLRKFFNYLATDNDPRVKAVDKAMIKIGYTWIGINDDYLIPPEVKGEVEPYLRMFGDRGRDRQENLHALIDRKVDKKRFTIHSSGKNWSMDLWYGTLQYGTPPDLRDGDGISFFQRDVKQHASIHVLFPGSFPSPTYDGSIYDNSLKIFDAPVESYSFATFEKLMTWLNTVHDKVVSSLTL